jgi:hypothetical protein
MCPYLQFTVKVSGGNFESFQDVSFQCGNNGLKEKAYLLLCNIVCWLFDVKISSAEVI